MHFGQNLAWLHFTSTQDRHAADFVYKLCTNKFYKDFRELSARGEKFAEIFKIGSESGEAEDGSLLLAWSEFRGKLAAAPISLQKSEVNFQGAFDDQDSETAEKVYARC